MRPSQADSVARAAMLCAGAMIAHQIGAKSARDALFLSSFGVTALPAMLASSALASLVFVLVAAKALHRVGPAPVLPIAFGISAVLQILEWVLVLRAPRWGAVAVYLHVASFGSVVISGFWSLLGERFDPRTAKRRVAWIAGAGTLGGLLGGLGTAALGRERGPESMLLPLAFLHLVCAWFSGRVGSPSPEAAQRGDAEDGPREGSALRLLREGPYLRAIVILVVTSSLGATLADYVLKAQASAQLDEAALLRFFAAFYTATGFLAFLIQLGLGRLSLERLGLSKTAATLPGALVAGGLSSILLPGLASAAAFRGAEAVVRASLYRLGYELLYFPLSPSRKRGFKTLVDVGFERLGDLAGAALVQLALLQAPQGALALLSALAAAAGIAGLWVVQGLERGYVRALEANLLSRAAAGAGQLLAAAARSTTLPVPVLGAADTLDSGLFLLTVAPASASEEAAASRPRPKPPPAAAPVPSLDPVVARLAELRSGDAERVRRALRAGPLHELLLPQAISLLAWDEVFGDAADALRKAAPKATGQLADALLDPQREFAIRRRVPRVLGAFASQRTVDGLAQGLDDPRFEVRFACGRALADLRAANPGLELQQERVFAVVTRELEVDRALWDGHRLLDWPESSEPGTLVEGLVRIRGGRGLEHVFTLLSLVLPREPLRVAYRALQTEDEAFRGTALEYLESVLPPRIRASLWPRLDDERPAPVARRREDVLDELMRSQSTIELSLRRGLRDATS